MGVLLTVFSVDVEMDIGSICQKQTGAVPDAISISSNTNGKSHASEVLAYRMPSPGFDSCPSYWHVACQTAVASAGRKVLQSTQKPAIYSPAKHSNCLKSATSCRIWGEIPLQPSSKSRLLKSTIVINIGTAFQRSTVHDSQDCAAHVYDSPAAEVA